MKRPSLIAVAVLLLPTPSLAQGQPPAPSIVTRGEAVIKRAPDQAWVSIAAETRASTPSEAQRLAAEAMTSVQSTLTKAGIPADAVKTTGYSLHPDMEYTGGRARVRGYIARNQIEVRVDDLAKIGPVIDAAGTSGATSIGGIRFDLKNREAAEREALGVAVKNAMARAAAIAAGAGVTLGPILRIDEHSEMPRPIPYTMTAQRDVMTAAPPTPITPGEVEIRANVTVTVIIYGKGGGKDQPD